MEIECKTGRRKKRGWKKERRASKEGGGSPMPACSRPALRRAPLRLPGGGRNRCAVRDYQPIRTQKDSTMTACGLFRRLLARGLWLQADGYVRPSSEKKGRRLNSAPRSVRLPCLLSLSGYYPREAARCHIKTPADQTSRLNSTAYRAATAVLMKVIRLFATALTPSPTPA